MFRTAGSPRFVADIKYKLTDDTADGRNADYYQLLAYTTALDLPEDVLIYCLDANRDSDADDLAAGPSMVDARAPAVRSVRVRHAGKVLHTYALDLSGTTEGVARNLDELGDWIEDRAATTVGAPMSAVG